MKDAEMSFAGISHPVSVEGLVVPAGSENPDTVVSEPEQPSSAPSTVSFLPNGDLASTTEVGTADKETVSEPFAERNASEKSSSAPANHTQITDSDLNTLIKEQSTNQLDSSDRQVSNNGRRTTPLQAVSSFASTAVDSELQDTSYSEYSATLVNDDTSGFVEDATQPISSAEGDQHEDSMSTTSTLLTGHADTQDPFSTNVENTVSPNRLAISYAAASRRIIINAEVVESLKVSRKDRRIEISMAVEKDDEMQLKGVVVS
jgi:20S proteasome subunit alpha 6